MLTKLIREYATLGGATVQVRRSRLLRAAGWQCTACPQGDSAHLRFLPEFETAANQHAAACRALPARTG